MEPVNYQPSQYPSQPPMQPPAAPVYAQSCLSAAWADIKATPHYVSRLLVLGLIMCVPILNFVVAGYLLRWSREVPFGVRTPLPQQMVTGKNFEFGFYAFVLALVVSLVGSVVGAIVGWVPLLGWVVSLAAILAVLVAAYLMQIRMIMGQSLGEGFNLSDLWEKGKRNWGQLLLVTLVPSLVVGVIVSIVLTIIIMLCAMLGLGASMPAIIALSNTAAPSFAQVMSLIGALAGPIIFGMVVIWVIAGIADVVAEALTIRGLGHWVARYAPEWTALDMTQNRF